VALSLFITVLHYIEIPNLPVDVIFRIITPIKRISPDVSADTTQRIIIANDVFVKIALPDNHVRYLSPNQCGNANFESADYGSD